MISLRGGEGHTITSHVDLFPLLTAKQHHTVTTFPPTHLSRRQFSTAMATPRKLWMVCSSAEMPPLPSWRSLSLTTQNSGGSPGPVLGAGRGREVWYLMPLF